MRRALGIAALAGGIVVALALAVGALLLADYSWKQVAEYHSPYVSDRMPAARAGERHSERVVLVIVDGLRVDASRQMRALETLRQHGSSLTLTAGQPSLSYPDWTTILSGSPQRVTGVTTNSFRARVPVETLLDTAFDSDVPMVVVGPSALDTLFGASRATEHYYAEYEHRYLSTELVQKAIEITQRVKPRFVLLHLPDVDEAGHKYGGASKEYLATAKKVDTDLSVLVSALQDGHTTFVIISDHGQIGTGGHGGWEPEVVHVPAVLAGSGVGLSTQTGSLSDLAPTVAVLAGLPSPRDALGRALPGVLATPSPAGLADEREQRGAFLAHYLDVVGEQSLSTTASLAAEPEQQLQARLANADETRLAAERFDRLPWTLAMGVAALLVLVVVGAMSVRALIAALAGAVVYYGVYDGLYFGLHRYVWSLSCINSEKLMKLFFGWRLGEAILAALLAVLVAGLVYPLLRQRPKGAWGEYLVGWLSLGPATVLTILATLAMQVAWYLWAWGPKVTWIIPDLRLGFKYDLDLLQAFAVGVTVLAAPLVTLVVGRYHPRVRKPDEAAPPLSDHGRIDAP